MADQNEDQAYDDPVLYSMKPNGSLATAVEKAATTHHVWQQGTADELPYVASAGHLTAHTAAGDPQASIFYVAYVLDNLGKDKRPVTFFFNGGPGSSTLPLHLGSWGPMRIVTGVPDTTVTSFPLIEAKDSLLTESGLVFVDAPATGYSQAVAPTTNEFFLDADQDAIVFASFIRRYLEVNERPTSPLYLYGESYGGVRGAIVTRLLQTAGRRVTGIVLNSPMLDNRPLAREALTLPSIAAVSTYHGRSDKPIWMDLMSYLEQVCTFTIDVYEPAVQTFNETAQEPSPQVLNALAAITGLPLQTVKDAFPPVKDGIPFLAHVDKLKPGYMLNTRDGRVTDQFDRNMGAAFKEAQKTYFSASLKYTCETPYATTTDSANLSRWHHGHGNDDALPDLETALHQNPKLRMLAISGYYDMSIPFFLVKRQLHRMTTPGDVWVRQFEGGHMTYRSDSARSQLRSELREFYQGV